MQNSQICLFIKVEMSKKPSRVRKRLPFRKLLVLLVEDPRYLGTQINTKESISETYCCSVQIRMYFLFVNRIILVILNSFFERV